MHHSKHQKKKNKHGGAETGSDLMLQCDALPVSI